METTELKTVLDLGLELISAGAKVSADGKVSLDDLPELLVVVQKVGPAVSAFAKAKEELANLDSAAGQEIVAYIVGKLAVGDDKAKLIVTKALGAALAINDLVKAIKA